MSDSFGARPGTTPRIVRRAVPAHWSSLAQALRSPLLGRLFAARGVASIEELRTDFGRLPGWQSMKGIVEAADRLVQAIDRRQRIVIVADYDADGATACAVGIEGLRRFGAEVGFLVPNRFEFGYGLTPEIVDLAARGDARVIVTVDNGIASNEGVARAVALGIDVVVTDHHLPGDSLPGTPWIVDPNQPGCAFPAKNLAGVGVMFYLLLAMRARLRERGAFAAAAEPRMAELLDLVAVGTVADVVRLDATNRILVAHGLARIRAGRARPGIAALFQVAGRPPSRATAFDLGFVCGPRINAAGRLADMRAGIECLLAPDAPTALARARQLDALNRERQGIEADMRDAALARVASIDAGDACTVCLFDAAWHQGVVGIVASRLKDRLQRPAMVFAPAGDGTVRGSGRSIPALHLRDTLDLITKRHPDLVLRFGGHAAAAGLTLAGDGLATFAEAFERAVREQLTSADLEREMPTDGSLEDTDLTLDVTEDLRGRVWGQGFPPPVFDDEFAVEAQRLVGGGHLRLRLERGGKRYESVLFHRTEPLPARIHAVYRPEVNDFQGSRTLQLVVEHWSPR